MANRAFVVDDERIIADTLAAILRSSGFEARAFYDGESALFACELSCPDCMISDVVMPGLGGIDLAIQIKQRFPACKVILFSGQAVTSDLLDAARKEGHEFELLQKPVHPKDLLAKLKARNLPLAQHATQTSK